MARLNFHHLRYFQEVAQAGSLTRAAASLNVSPSSVSVQIQQLEAQLGHTLFDRIGRQMILTEAGRVALDHAEEIFAVGEELIQNLSGIAETRSAHLRVGALATLSRNFQVGFLAPLAGRKGLHLVLRSGTLKDLVAALESHQLDVLLTNTLPARTDESAWVAHRLDDQPISLIGPKGPHRRKRPLEAVLASEALILPTPESHIRGDIDAYLHQIGVTPRIVAEVDDMAMISVMARAGLGFAIVPPIVVRDELASGELAEYGRLPALKERFFAIVPRRRFPNPTVDALLAAQKSRKEKASAE